MEAEWKLGSMSAPLVPGRVNLYFLLVTTFVFSVKASVFHQLHYNKYKMCMGHLGDADQ